jgi:PKD repeat protein
MVVAVCGMAYGDGITVSQVDGLAGPDAVIMDGQITFHIRMTSPDDNHKGLTNAWRIYSPTGATWDTTIGLKTDALDDHFDWMNRVYRRSITGADSDTIAIVCAVMDDTVGMPPGFDSVTHLITIGPIDAAFEGGEICIDSAFYPPSGVWTWDGTDAPLIPTWGGPYCYCIGACAVAEPVINCPGPIVSTLCGAEEICVALDIDDADEVTVSPSGTWEAGELCFTTDGSSPAEVITVTASNGGGSVICLITFNNIYTAVPVITCPGEAFDFELSAPGLVCVPLTVANAPGGVIADNDAVWGAGDLCLNVTAGTYVIEVIAIGDAACGVEDTCEVTVNVTILPDVTIDCPAEDYVVELCELEEVCVSLVIENQTGVAVDNDGTWAAGELCFTPTGDGPYTFHIEAAGNNGPATCDVTVIVNMAVLAEIDCPTEPFEVTIGEVGEVCVPLDIINYDIVTADNGATWAESDLCFIADGEGSYPFMVTATSVNGACDPTICAVMVNVTISPAVAIDCPTGDYQRSTCAAGDEICVPLQIFNYTNVTVDNGATWDAGNLCFIAQTEGPNVFLVTAEGQDGPVDCELTVFVSFTGLPEFTECSDDEDVTICPGETFCADIVVENYDEVTTNFGIWSSGQFCFLPDANDVYSVVITATNACGTVTCEFYVNVSTHEDPIAAFTPVPAEGAVPLDVSFVNTSTGYDLVYSWDFGDGSPDSELFEPDHTYGEIDCYEVVLTVTDGCGEVVTATQEVCVIDNQVVVPSDRWVVLGCEDPTYDDLPLRDGTVVTAYDQGGTLCGMTVYDTRGIMILTIYGDSPYTPGIDEGMDVGEIIVFKFNGVEVFPETPIEWDNMGDPTPGVCAFFTEISGCMEFSLDAEWHLISWNRHYSAPVGDFVALIEAGGGTVDIVLSFDQAGLTYDPDLPLFSTLHDVDYNHGYWVHLSTASDFEICGDDVVSGGIPIYTGWNLVSYLPGESNTVENSLISIWDVLILVYGYDYGYFDYVKGDPLRAQLEDMGPGFGYWIRTDGDGMLTYPGFDTPGKLVDRAPSIVSPVTTTRNWMSLYGQNITVDGEVIPTNSTIEAYTLSGILCGVGDYTNDMLKFTSVYGADENAPSLPQIGDRVEIRINGEAVTRDIIFGENGTTVDLSNLAKGADLLPTSFGLSQNYPNPFNPSTTISFNLPSAGTVTLSVYNVLGQSVNTLTDEYLAAGEHNVTWNGDDANGNSVTSGVYFYKITTSDFSETKKMILMK